MKHIKHWLATMAVLLCSMTVSAAMTFPDWTSTNKGQAGSTSSKTYTITANAGDVLTFDWVVSSESNYDKLIVTLSGSEIINKSGEYSGTYEYSFTQSGTYTLLVKYTKDGSVDRGNDYAKVYNIILVANDGGSTGSDDSVIASGTCGDNLTWKLSDEGELTIEGTGAMYDYSYGSSPWYNNQTSIKKVTIQNGVSSIGDRAFQYCSSITSITLPESLTSIGDSAFQDCGSITSINIPECVTSIGDYAFWYCSSITSINIPEWVTSINRNVFGYCSALASISIPEKSRLTSIGYEAFCGCSSLTSITIPKGVTEIGSYAFQDCSSLISITIPEGVTEIGLSAFWDCNSLISITIPEGVTEIEPQVFFGCSSLTSITIPEGVTEIGMSAFFGCSSLTSITIPKSVISIGGNVFCGCSSIESIIVKEGNTIYDSRNDCNAIIETGSNTLVTGCVSTIIPEDVTSIGASAFLNCSSLTSIILPEGVISIGDNAFKNCSQLKTVINLSPLTISQDSSNGYVGYYASKIVNAPNGYINGDWVYGMIDGVNILFGYLGGDTEIVLPQNCGGENYVIDENLFKNNTSITGITISNGVISIEDYAFYGCSGLEYLVVESGNMTYDSRDNCNAIIESGSNMLVWGCKNTLIPAEVESIANYAFYGCSNLTNIQIPNSITSIGDYAFCGCTGLKTVINLSSLTINKGSSSNGYVGCYADRVVNASSVYSEGDFIFLVIDGVKTLFQYQGNDSEIVLPDDCNGENYVIGEDAFKNNTNITSVEIPSSVTSIGRAAFYGCTSLADVNIPNSVTSIGESAFSKCSSLESITIPNGLSRIENYTFNECSSLASIIIPNSVTTIGERSFYGCRKLKKLILGNSVSRIKTNAFEYCSGLTCLVVPQSVVYISSNVFHGCTQLKTIINFSSLEFERAEISNGYVGYYADEIRNFDNGSIEGDYVFGVNNGVNILTLYWGSDTEIELPKKYKGENYIVGGGSFKNNTTITTVISPEVVAKIRKLAFSGCSNRFEVT